MESNTPVNWPFPQWNNQRTPESAKILGVKANKQKYNPFNNPKMKEALI